MLKDSSLTLSYGKTGQNLDLKTGPRGTVCLIKCPPPAGTRVVMDNKGTWQVFSSLADWLLDAVGGRGGGLPYCL